MFPDLSNIEPYDLKVSEGVISYTFTTDNQINYLVVFDNKTSLYSSEEIGNSVLFEYQFFPEKYNNKELIDVRIIATVMHSIALTMKNNANVILYICENSDDRAKVRNRYFDSVFRRYSPKELSKMDGTVRTSILNEDLSFVSVIVNEQNPDKDKVNKTFERALFKNQLKKDPSFNI